MKKCLLFLTILFSVISISFGQSKNSRDESVNSAIYFKYCSFRQMEIANKALFNSDYSFSKKNLDLVIDYLNGKIKFDSLELEVKDSYTVSREEYNNMTFEEKDKLNKFIESLHLYIDAIEPIQYPKELGYLLPDNEIQELGKILGNK